MRRILKNITQREGRNTRAWIRTGTLLCVLLACWALAAPAQRDAARDRWQRPAEVMDILGIGPGSAVADVGCGEGYFVEHLSRRVGPEGTVYAVDIDESALRQLRRRVERENLGNVRVIKGKEDDPLLPAGALDAVLIVNAYHEMREHDAVLQAIYQALKPGGRLAVIDAPDGESQSREEQFRRHAVSESLVRSDAERAGFHFHSRQRDFERPESRRRVWYFLVFEK